MRSVVATLGLASLLLAACASGPHPPPDLRLPAAYEAPKGPPPAAAQLDRWWTVFADPQLDSLIDTALVFNPDAKTAAARLREARATWFTDMNRFLPQGQIDAQAGRSETQQLSGTAINIPGVVIPGLQFSGFENAYQANFNVSWEADIFGREEATRRAANADVAAARFDYESTRASLAAQVADAYFQSRGLAIQLADAQETARIDTDLYNLTSRRAALGLGASADADRTAGDLARAQAQVEALKADLQAEKRTLLILAGRTYEPTASVDTPPDVGRPPAIPGSLPSDLLRRRPDVRSAEAKVVGAVGREDLARLAFLPTFTLKPGLGWSKTVENDAEIGLSTWTLAGAIAQPILNIPNLMAELRVQDARTVEAVAAYEKTLQTAFGEAEGALVRLDADRRRVALLTDGEVRARRAYEASRLGYTLGLNDLQTTLSSETAWRATRTELTSAQVEAVRQAVQAFKAIGGGWPGADAPATAQAARPPAG
jgi:NodT family efflux transporter outer membrane factor (OMF) lipoprotein